MRTFPPYRDDQVNMIPGYEPPEVPQAPRPAREKHRFRIRAVFVGQKPVAKTGTLRQLARPLVPKAAGPRLWPLLKKAPGVLWRRSKKALKTLFAPAEKKGRAPLRARRKMPAFVPAKAPAKPGAWKSFDLVRYGVLFLCLTVFFYSGYTLIHSFVSRAQGRELYDQLSQLFHQQSPFADGYLPNEVPNPPSVDLLSAYIGVKPEVTVPEVTDPSAQSQIDRVIYLKNNKNRDTLGWIMIEGTNIDYPVVHTTNNDYYLRRSYERRSNLSGSLFADRRNTKKLMDNRNTVIYGHNMSDGSMFNNLHDLRNQSVFDKCQIRIVTPNGIFIYQVFSVHEAKETSQYFQTRFTSDAKFEAWLEEMRSQSLFQKEGLELGAGDRILTLSTCLDPILQSDYRWAVHAKLVQVINYTP